MSGKQYDYLVVGAGFYGSVFAHEASCAGKKCMVIDKRSHIGGNCFTHNVADINVHEYGAHIFFTRQLDIWQYINKFSEFNHYVNSPIAMYKDEMFNLPFNMNTFRQLWGVKTPAETRKIIDQQTASYRNMDTISNLEQQSLSLVGRDIYEKLIKEYSEKQWGKPADQLPAFLIKRLPLRLTYNNNYYDVPYQGIPVGGYTKIFEKLLKNSEVRLNTDFMNDRENLSVIAEKIIFTGPIDEYFEYCYGALDYRSLRFEHKMLNGIDNYQGNAVVNYTSHKVPYTRTIEHKHFEFGEQPDTVISYEYPQSYETGTTPYYPVNDEKNDKLYKKYSKLAENEKNVVFGGRLGEFSYYNMDQSIASALKLSASELQG